MLLQLMGWNLGGLQDLLVSDNWLVIKQEQQEHLVRRCQEFVLLALEDTKEFSIAKVEFPVEHPAIVVLAVIELSKSSHRVADLSGQIELQILVFEIVWPVTTSKHFHVEVNV